jgi:hypothetical protein
MDRRWGASKANKWRWQAAKLRARAAVADNDAMREQLMVFAADCEEEARTEESIERIEWRRA